MGARLVAEIEGLRITPLKEITDERGAVLHMLRADAEDFQGFGECYFSEVNPGVVKAWKRHLRQTQNFAVPRGRMRLVIFDDREDSPTHGVVREIEFGRPAAYVRVHVPPRVWYGFACLGSEAALMVNCADLLHDPQESESRPVDDAAIPYRWAGGEALVAS